MNPQPFENERNREFLPASKQTGQLPDDKKNPANEQAEQERHPQSHLFTLRVWQEALGEGQVEWRGRVHDVTSGETFFFRDWPGLTATLQRLIGAPAAATEASPGEPVDT